MPIAISEAQVGPYTRKKGISFNFRMQDEFYFLAFPVIKCLQSEDDECKIVIISRFRKNRRKMWDQLREEFAQLPSLSHAPCL